MFRSAMSVPANIAEGRSHKSEKEFARFLGYAVHSSSELEHHLLVARDLKVMTEPDFDSLTSQTITVRKMLYGLLQRLRENKRGGSNPARSPQRSSCQREAGSLDFSS